MKFAHISILIITLTALIIYGIVSSSQTEDSATQAELETVTEELSEDIVVRVPATQKLHATATTPQSPDGPDSHWFYSEPLTFTEDTVITGFSATMEGADISILHHTTVGLTNRPATVCPGDPATNTGGYELFSASRNTLDPVVIPEPYGLFIEAGETLMVEFMAHPQAAPHGSHPSEETLTPELVVTMQTASDRTVPVSFARLRLDDSPCAEPFGHQAFSVPTSTDGEPYTKTAADSFESASYVFGDAATIIASGANFWPRKGGESVSIQINNEEVANRTAEKGSADYAWNIPIVYDTIGIPASSTMTISSTYTNPFSTPIRDASGMFAFYYTTLVEQ